MRFVKVIKSKEDYTPVTYKGYRYEQLSDKAKEKVKQKLNETFDPYYEDDFNEDVNYVLTHNFKEYNITKNDLDIDADGYGHLVIKLKNGKLWPAFDKILKDCAKQVLKKLPTFQNKPELLEDWAAEAASDMYFNDGYFETYAGLNDIDGYDGFGLSYEICDLCNTAYEEKIEPVLDNIISEIKQIIKERDDYRWSDEYAQDTCDANGYLFDENGNIL